jgi:glycosyltransferase involved in cell wall biosynthesis
VIGCSFDYASTIERKNPVGVVRAFTRAFPVPFELGPDIGPWLVLKTHGNSEHDGARGIVRNAVGSRPDIVVIDADFTDEQQHAFYRRLDVFVSLHRSEGYGLAPLEAMALGIPTIATAYSGNLSFMTPENSWLIPAGRSTVPTGCGLYPAGSIWAEPDLDAAAVALRDVAIRRSSTEVVGRAARGRSDVAPLVSGIAGEAWVRERLAAIRRAR